jgi:hypothetical protein
MKTFNIFFIALCFIFSNFGYSRSQTMPEQAITQLTQSIYHQFHQYYYQPNQLQKIRSILTDFELSMKKGDIKETDYIRAFNTLWSNQDISHIQLQKTHRTSEQIYHYVEHLNVGKNGSTLSYSGDTAILTISTMMGRDNESQIQQFMNEVIENDTSDLVIDLRGNKGGAFVVKTLLPYFFEHTTLVGAFVSKQWFIEQKKLPTIEDIAIAPTYLGNSLMAFWEHIQHVAVSRVSISPAPKLYRNNVYVLINEQTESAAEMTAAALAQLENVTLVGQSSAGKMLSQKMYDVAPGLQLSLPIATYIDHSMQPIEGKGVPPNTEVNSDQALRWTLNHVQYNRAISYVH